MALARELGLLIIPHTHLSSCKTISLARGFASTTGNQWSVRCHWAAVPSSARPSLCDRQTNVEKLWGEFFSDTSQWWDHRCEKVCPNYPDFKHKNKQKSLWLDNYLNPPWVEAKLAAMTPGTLHSNIFLWNLRLRRYAKAGDYTKVMELFEQVQRKGMIPDRFTFVPVLNACSKLQALTEGRRIHLQIIKTGFEGDVYVANSLVDMYAKCGSVDDARSVFNKMPIRDVVGWSALILGYAKCGQGYEALELFRQMQEEGVDPSSGTFVGVLSACAHIPSLEQGRRAHQQIIDQGYESNVNLASCLVDMYAKCGSIGDARRVFNKMLTKNEVAWITMILGYVSCGQGHEAWKLARLMQRKRLDMNPVTFVGLLKTCASIGALEEGKRLHKEIVDKGYDCDVSVANCLVDMYGKCGSLEDARKVFDQMPTKDVIGWNAMLAGYCRHGYVKEALQHFERMCQEVKVNAVSFVSLLSACTYGGLVDDGLRYFESMTAVFNVSPTLEHYACVVHLLGLAGHLKEAESLIWTMPHEADAWVWMSLLAACRTHGDVEIAESVVKRVRELDPGNAAGYVVLSNMYAAAGKWDSCQAVPRLRLERDVK